ncbi:hypothetical protein KP509_01G123400 [Ceratopteris richardii]|nr:hypothetical protein KP509_01G123400 [Ceratopteris richardii]
MSRLNKENKLDHLDGELLKALSLAFARGEMCELSSNTFRLLLQKHHYPPLALWKSLMQIWMHQPRGPLYVVKIFLQICRYCNDASPEHQKGILSVAPDKEAFDLALRACSQLGELGKAEDVMRRMSHFKICPDNDSFSLLIKTYEKGGNLDRMLNVLLRMREAQTVPSRTTLNSLLTACIRVGEVDIAAEVVLCWSGKFRDDSKLGFGLSKDVIHEEFHESLRDWRTTIERPCGETFTLVLKGYLEKNRVTDAAKFLGRLCSRENSEHVPCSFVLNGVVDLGLRDEVHTMLQEMASLNAPADSMAYTNLIKAYCKLPQPLKAEAVLRDARQAGHSLDIGSYVPILDAFNLLQDYDCAHRLFRDMKQNDVVPLEPIMNKLLSVFEKEGKPYVMRKLLDTALMEPRLKVDLHDWNRTIQTFSRQKLMFDAKATVKKMRQAGFEPDARTYTFLLGGYILMGSKINEILLLWAEIKERLASSPSTSSTSLKLNEELLNGFLTFFVKYGYFRHALDVIARMEERSYWADKQKLRNMYWHLHRDLYTSKHRSQRRIDMSQERRKEVAAFKAWIGYPT